MGQTEAMRKIRKQVGDNLYRVDFEDGRSYYFVRVQIDGKRRERSIGTVKEMTLREAREKAREFMSANAPERIEPDLFGAVYEKAIADIKSVKRWRNPKSEHQWIQTVETYALPVLGNLRMQAIERHDILQVLKPIWDTKPETASRLQQRLEQIFDWAIVRGLRTDANPATWRGNLSFFLPPKNKVRETQHHEAPTLAELKAAVAYFRKNRNAGSGILLFTIATVCRIGEARFATADQIDGDCWNVPPENQKIPGVRRVPLSTLAMGALTMAEDKGLLFPGQSGPLAIDTPRLKLTAVIGRKVTVHGIRSTFRDWAAENGIQDAVAEKCLSHSWGTEVTRAYYRTDLYEERREALEAWARALFTK